MVLHRPVELAVFAGNFHAPSGTHGGGANRRGGQCADGFAADASAGPGGARLSGSAAGRRLGVSGAGWGVVEGAARVWATAGAAVGGLRDPAGWHPRTAGLHASQE